MHQPTEADYSSPESAGDSADYAEPHLLTSTDLPAPPSSTSCGSTANQLLPPGFSTLRAPPPVYPTGPSLLPPLGFYSSCASTYGAAGFPGSTSTYAHTSWATNYNSPCSHLNGVPQSFSAPYSTYPPIFAGSYGALPPPLHHPEPVAADSTVTTSGFTGRKRPREDDIIPAKNFRPTVSLELPTPPDSSSDRSGTISPQNYFQQPDILPLQSSVPASIGLSPPLSFPAPPMPQNGIHVSLTAKTEELWNLFYSANTEMIVTKNGR